MPNSDTDHSRELRRKHAKARRAKLKDLSAVLLNKEEEGKLQDLRRWFGTPDKPETWNATVKKLIEDAWRQLPPAAKSLDQVEIPLK